MKGGAVEDIRVEPAEGGAVVTHHLAHDAPGIPLNPKRYVFTDGKQVGAHIASVLSSKGESSMAKHDGASEPMPDGKAGAHHGGLHHHLKMAHHHLRMAKHHAGGKMHAGGAKKK